MDGPADAACGVTFSGDAANWTNAGWRIMLDNQDSYASLKRCGILFKTGLTRTNVMDIARILVQPRVRAEAHDCMRMF